jgi:sec-independent protein translocase protein TatB
MFDLGWSEMAIILLVALIVIGPKDLPRVARTVGQWVGKARAMAREFQNSLEDMAREAELDKVKDEIEKASRFNPKREIEKTIDPTGSLKGAFDVNPLASTRRGDRGKEDRPKETGPAPVPQANGSGADAAGDGGEQPAEPTSAPDATREEPARRRVGT